MPHTGYVHLHDTSAQGVPQGRFVGNCVNINDRSLLGMVVSAGRGIENRDHSGSCEVASVAMRPCILAEG